MRIRRFSPVPARRRAGVVLCALGAAALLPGPGCAPPVRREAAPARLPRIAGAWWTVAGDPDLGPLTDPKQQPVDFAMWQAADGTWQLWSCIRKTRCGGWTRLFHHWEGKRLTDPDWKPMGIAMQAEPALGETAGGLQAPFVMRVGDAWMMFYGDWERICLAASDDSRAFSRRLSDDGSPALFSEGVGSNARDPMVLKIGDLYHCYYTANPGQKGAVYARTSRDLRHWSASRRVAHGGAAGTGPWSAECPFVVYREEERAWYLFRTQHYGEKAQTMVYRSEDPLNFGVDDDRRLVCTLPVAAPEIIRHEGRWYIAALRSDLKGIQVAPLEWGGEAE